MALALFGIDILAVEIFHLVKQLPYYLLNTVLAIMPTIGYIDQLKTMIQTKDSSGFNMTACLILLCSNSLRFIYWTFEPFQAYLLGQSICVFSIQLLLALKSFEYSDDPHAFATSMSRIRWRIPTKEDIVKYCHIYRSRTSLEFSLSLVLYGLLIITLFIVLSIVFGMKITLEIYVFASNIIDTTVSFPSFKKIVFDHNVENCSVVLLVQYLLGDVLKLILFLVGGSGMAFIFGALLQTTVDSTNAITYFILSRRKQKEPSDKEYLLPNDEALP